MVSLMTRSRPKFLVSSNSNKREDKNRAKVTDLTLDAKWEIDNERLNHIYHAKMAASLVCSS